MGDSPLTVYLARHGETDYNRRRLMQGQRIDAPLNARGHAQATALADRFRDEHLDAIYVSPLVRARETARPVAQQHPDTPLVVDPDLAEMSWGELEGRPIDDVADRLRAFGAAWRSGSFADRVGGGESVLDVRDRAARFLDRIAASHDAPDRILVVTHGRYLRVLLATALPAVGLLHMDRFGHANTGVYRLVRSGDRYEVDLQNCTAHLQDPVADA